MTKIVYSEYYLFFQTSKHIECPEIIYYQKRSFYFQIKHTMQSLVFLFHTKCNCRCRRIDIEEMIPQLRRFLFSLTSVTQMRKNTHINRRIRNERVRSLKLGRPLTLLSRSATLVALMAHRVAPLKWLSLSIAFNRFSIITLHFIVKNQFYHAVRGLK